MERKTIQIDANIHGRLIKHCQDKKYNVGGWASKVIMDAIYTEKHGVAPIEKITAKIKSKTKTP